jgi:RNA polymerase sigma-70 factor (ECF subfamily)
MRLRAIESTQREPDGPGDLVDRALLAAAAAGDMRAFERLYRRHFRAVYEFAARVSGSPDLAGEVAGDSFAVAWRSAGRFEGRSRVSTWLFGIAYRLAARARGRRARLAAEVALDEAGSIADPGSAGVEAALLAHRLAGALEELPPAQRAVVELTYANGLGYPEIAAILGCPVGTVKTRMLHARRRLRAKLGIGGGTHER